MFAHFIRKALNCLQILKASYMFQWTPLDGWHLKLAREIKHAGIEPDLNKVI